MGKILYYIRSVVVVALSECKNKKEENFTTGNWQQCCNKYLSHSSPRPSCAIRILHRRRGIRNYLFYGWFSKGVETWTVSILIMRIVINMSEMCSTVLLKLAGFFSFIFSQLSIPCFKNYSLLKITNPLKKKMYLPQTLHLIKSLTSSWQWFIFQKKNVDLKQANEPKKKEKQGSKISLRNI